MTIRRAAFGAAMAGAAWAAVALAPASAQDFGPNRRPESQSGRTNSQDVGALKRRIDELERRLEDMSANGTASGPSARAPAGARAGGSAGEKFAELEIERLYDMAVLNFRRGNDLAARNLFETVIARGADSPFANKSQEYLRLLYRNDRRAGTGRGERRWHWRDLGAPYPGADQSEADRDERAGSSGVRERPEPEQRRAEPAQREPGVRDAGVRDAATITPPPMKPAAAAASAPSKRPPTDPAALTQKLQRSVADDFKAAVGDRVFFSEGSADLGSRGLAVVDAQADWLAQHAEVSVRIEGHADDAGASAELIVLAQLRAESVRQRMLQRGVESKRVIAAGFGRDRRMATCEEAACKAQNRRVITSVAVAGSGQTVGGGESEAANLAEAAFESGKQRSVGGSDAPGKTEFPARAIQ